MRKRTPTPGPYRVCDEYRFSFRNTDVSGMPQRDFLRGIELLGTRVLPQIRAELGTP